MSDGVLLTGATGFLGGHVLKALLDASHRVVVLKRRTSTVEHLGDAVTFIDSDAAPLAQSMADAGIDTVVHLACDQGRGDARLSNLLQTNVMLGVHLLEAAQQCGVVRFINADTQLDASVNAYARSKKQFAQWLPQFAGTFAIANLRLGNIYGPGEPEAGFLRWLLGEFSRGVPSIDFTPGEQMRDFIHAADVSSATLAIMASMSEPSLATYDVGSGQMTSLRQFVETAHAAYRDCAGEQGSALNFGGLPYRQGEVMQPVFDTGALRSLGWQPQYSLESGLRHTIEAHLALVAG